MKVNVKESTIIRPSKDMPSRRMWLSAMDLMHTRYHLPTVYLYTPNGSSNFFESNVLKESLSQVLVPFYPVAGRLGRDENGRIEINCNGEGVLFVDADADFAASDLGDFMPCKELQQLVPMVDYSADMSSYPLLVLQVTRFRCGGICLGVGWHHTLADGMGALHFISSWANTAKGLSITIPPFLDRTILSGRIPPNPTFHHVEFNPPPTLNTPTGLEEAQSRAKTISVASLKLTPDQVKTLKAKVNNSESNKNETKYTTYEILTGHAWRCTSMARSLSNDQATKLGIVVDGRSRLDPPLPPGYLGNVIFIAAPIATSSELEQEPLVNTVERVHKAIKRMDNEYLRSALDLLEIMSDKIANEPGPQASGSPNLLVVVSWLKLPLYDADFGWGPPLLMRPGWPEDIPEGNGYIFPSPANDGSLSFTICLEAGQMQVFQKLFYTI